MNKFIKNIAIKSSFIGFIALFFVSCEDFLDKNPTTQISEPTFWKTKLDADLALSGVYARLNCNTFNFEGVFALEIMAGDANEGSQSLGSASTGTFALGIMTPTSGGLLYNVYNECYRGISTANVFLSNIDKCDMPEDIRTRYKAEVHFLRALFYFTLTEHYGGVVVYTEQPKSIEESKIAKSPQADVIEQIISDLDIAIAGLPNTAYNGYAVKGSALVLKSRVLMFDSDNINPDWAGAAAAAKQVMTDNKFSLYKSPGLWRNIFLKYGQSGNPEIMFSTRYLNPDNSNTQDIRILWHGVFVPRVEPRDAYECTDGLPITESPLYVPPTPTQPSNWKINRDPRLLETMRNFTDSAVKADGKKYPFAYNGISPTGLACAKGGDVETLPIDYATKSESDWILIRYAEALMNFAEATNELSGPTAEVYNAVNEVRQRPGVDMPPLPAGLTKDEMRARIWNERRVEFGFEGMRYRDIRRWKLAETYIPTLVEGTGIRRAFDPSKHYVWPFPQSEIDVNPQLKQNPNY